MPTATFFHQFFFAKTGNEKTYFPPISDIFIEKRMSLNKKKDENSIFKQKLNFILVIA